MGDKNRAGPDPDEAMRQFMEQHLERDNEAKYGDKWPEVKRQQEEQAHEYWEKRKEDDRVREAEAPARRTAVLSEYLARRLADDEVEFMAIALDAQADGLSDDMLAIAGRLSEAITKRKDELKAMPAREQYRHKDAIHQMLNMMEGFYLFGGTSFVERNGVRASHPWGAVLYQIYDVFDELGDIHLPLMAREMYEMHVGNLHGAAADARWSKLDSAKQLAFARRKKMSGISRAEAIRRMLPEVLEAARKAGVPLTGQDPETTIAGWFRKAGIR